MFERDTAPKFNCHVSARQKGRADIYTKIVLWQRLYHCQW